MINQIINSNTNVLIVSAIVSQLIAIAMLPIISRLYGPENFGYYGLFSAINGILAVVPTLRYEMAILSAETKVVSYQLVLYTIIILFISLILLFPFVYIVNTYLNINIGFEDINNNVILILLSLIAICLNMILYTWCTKIGSFKRVGLSQISQQVIFSTLSITLVILFELESLGLIISFILSQVFIFIILVPSLFLDIGSSEDSKLKNANFFNILKQYRRFPIYSLPASIFNAASNHLPIIVIGVLYTEFQVGLFVMAMKIIQLPMYLLGNSIGRVFSGEFSNEQRLQGRQDLFEKCVLKLVNLIMIPCLFLISWGEDIFNIIFGFEWGDSGLYCSLMAFYLFFWFTNSPISIVNSIIGKQKNDLYFQLLMFVLKVGGIYLGYIYSGIELSILLMSLMGGAACFFYTLNISHSLNRSFLSILTKCKATLITSVSIWVFSLILIDVFMVGQNVFGFLIVMFIGFLFYFKLFVVPAFFKEVH